MREWAEPAPGNFRGGRRSRPLMTRLEAWDRDRARSSLPFFLVTFAFTWALQVPAVLAQGGLLPGDPEAYLPFAMLGIFGPTVAAVWLTRREGGRAAVRRLFASLARWRTRWTLYVAALLVPGALLSAGLWLMSFAGYEGRVLLAPDAERLLVIPVIAVAEEIGWRGYALPRLQARHGALAASAILGAVWTVWHVPMFLGVGIPLDTLPVMLLFFVGGSIFYTWLFNQSGGSVLLVVLAHAGAHLNNAHLPLPDDALPLLVATVVYAALGLGVALLDRKMFGLERRR